MRVIFRPLLVHGTLATMSAEREDVILIDSDQPEAEQTITLWHETLHLLGLKDEDQVEAMARRLANACPEILAAVKVTAADIHCGLCSWSGPREKLLGGEACPACKLVL